MDLFGSGLGIGKVMLILGNFVGEVQGLRKSKITGGSEYPENGSSV